MDVIKKYIAEERRTQKHSENQSSGLWLTILTHPLSSHVTWEMTQPAVCCHICEMEGDDISRIVEDTMEINNTLATKDSTCHQLCSINGGSQRKEAIQEAEQDQATEPLPPTVEVQGHVPGLCPTVTADGMSPFTVTSLRFLFLGLLNLKGQHRPAQGRLAG